MLTKLLPVRYLEIFSGLLQRLSRLRRFALFLTLGLSLSLAPFVFSPTNTGNAALMLAQNSANQSVVVRIGYQKAATILNALKAKKDLEKALTAGAKVTWTEFPADPPMLEAINAGSID